MLLDFPDTQEAEIKPCEMIPVGGMISRRRHGPLRVIAEEIERIATHRTANSSHSRLAPLLIEPDAFFLYAVEAHPDGLDDEGLLSNDIT